VDLEVCRVSLEYPERREHRVSMDATVMQVLRV